MEVASSLPVVGREIVGRNKLGQESGALEFLNLSVYLNIFKWSSR